MRTKSNQPVTLLLAVLLMGTGCSLAIPEPAAVACTSDAECPADGERQFRCVDSGGGQKFCEIRFPYNGPQPGGGDVTYCNDIKPLMETYCVSCHGEASNSSNQAFRLDHYEAKTSQGGAAQQGVYDLRNNIKLRMVDKTPTAMPPSTSALQPALAELDVVFRWVAAGGPYAPESAVFNASIACGGGGGGGNVSFSGQVLPLFQNRCGGCHAYLASHADLVGKPAAQPTITSCADATKNLIEPNNPDASYIWLRMSSATPACGSLMPLGAAAVLPANELDILRNWINQGAPNN